MVTQIPFKNVFLGLPALIFRSDIYLGKKERHIMDWHFANLEFANATTLDRLSVKHWDQDDENEMAGEHFTVLGGYASLPVALGEGITVNASTAVKKIRYNDLGVEVRADFVNVTNYTRLGFYRAQVCAKSDVERE